MSAKRRVRVLEGWSVYVADERRNGGDEVEVAADTANHWIASGWAEPVEDAKPVKRRTTSRVPRK